MIHLLHRPKENYQPFSQESKKNGMELEYNELFVFSSETPVADVMEKPPSIMKLIKSGVKKML